MSGAATARGTSAPVRPAWYAAELTGDARENPITRTLRLRVPDWPGHLPGQHADVRLTADDGYRAVRSYSLAAPADGANVELTVQEVPAGEVSTYLVEGLPVGASVELLGPIGGWFVLDPADPAPVLLVAGGAGIVPVMCMLRARRDRTGAPPYTVAYSLRSPDVLCYGDELGRLATAGGAGGGTRLMLAYTRRAPSGHPRPPGRLTPSELAALGPSPDARPACFVCGPTGFVEAVAATLVDLGHDPSRVKTERFGPSGG
ncbi:FAD-binding oxidoreductase [Actinomadura sp. WMMB 499]|uniref:FAD-binding oxidoreductase n=1 Tax=Actinomadura sp. WMMB 499 TaxID=1219491 RepID=UPI0012491874|nr:FAD-binding oxidoreductase [Actinomadura sp. WMMB 499]QFG21747.1 oxidoreductase [Actinomadura sp. WMMB 499]